MAYLNFCSIIRCWDTKSFHESYRITVGLGGLGSGPELCIWSLLFLRYCRCISPTCQFFEPSSHLRFTLLYFRCGTLVSGDSTGSVQFWDSHHGTLLQAHTNHKGDVNALVTVPSHKRVFSAGSDGQVPSFNTINEFLG